MVAKVDEGPQDCPGCGGTYYNENSLRDHLNRCDKEKYSERYGRKAKVYKCPEPSCPYVTDRSTNMSHHMKDKHAPKPICPACKRKLSCDGALRTHLSACSTRAFIKKYQKVPTVYKCDVCVFPDYSTSFRSTFAFHMKKKHGRGVNADLHASPLSLSASMASL